MLNRFVRFFCIVIAIAAIAPQVQADENGARAYVDGIGKQVIDIIGDENIADGEKQARLRQIFTETIDFDWVGKFVLGKHWRTATPDQQQRYLANYKNFVIANYTSKFKQYSGQTFKIKSVTNVGDGDYVLKMSIQDPNPKKPDILLDYKVREEGKDYRIFDIVVEGVSLITTQRSEFDSVVSRKGLDALIDLLGKKAQV